MTANANAQESTPTRADGTTDPHLQLVGAVPAHRRPRRSSRPRNEPPDLGVLAREAVVRVLHDATLATAESEAVPAARAVMDAEAATPEAAGHAAQSPARFDREHVIAGMGEAGAQFLGGRGGLHLLHDSAAFIGQFYDERTAPKLLLTLCR